MGQCGPVVAQSPRTAGAADVSRGRCRVKESPVRPHFVEGDRAVRLLTPETKERGEKLAPLHFPSSRFLKLPGFDEVTRPCVVRLVGLRYETRPVGNGTDVVVPCRDTGGDGHVDINGLRRTRVQYA